MNFQKIKNKEVKTTRKSKKKIRKKEKKRTCDISKKANVGFLGGIL